MVGSGSVRATMRKCEYGFGRSSGQSGAGEAGGLRRLIQENFHNALRSVAVPLFGNATRPGVAVKYRVRFLHDSLRVSSDKHVGSDLARNRSLGVRTHGEAGDSQTRGFLLYPPAVGENQTGARDKTEEGQIAQ